MNNKFALTVCLGLLGFGCNRSREAVPTPSAAVPTSSHRSLPFVGVPSASASAVFAPPVPWSTSEPAAEEAPSVLFSEAPVAAPKDLGPDARPVRFTKHVELVKSLEQLSTAWAGPVNKYGSELELAKTTADGNGDTRTVKTCADFLKAKDEGWKTATAEDYNGEGYFREKCVPLWFLRHAWPSRKSHLGDFRLDVPAPLSLLPADFDILVSTERDEEKRAAIARGTSLAEFHRGLKVTKKDAITVEWAEPAPDTMEVRLKVMAFGDVNHDGLEDVLFFQLGYDTEGSYRAYQLFVMTRKQEKGLLVMAMELSF
jgi:hypothetical protein